MQLRDLYCLARLQKSAITIEVMKAYRTLHGRAEYLSFFNCYTRAMPDTTQEAQLCCPSFAGVYSDPPGCLCLWLCFPCWVMHKQSKEAAVQKVNQQANIIKAKAKTESYMCRTRTVVLYMSTHMWRQGRVVATQADSRQISSSFNL